MSACKYYDCGWCYAPDYLKTNAVQGGCFEPEYCPSQMTDLQFTSPSGETTIKVQDTGRLGTVAPKTKLHIRKTPMTEIEEVKAQIQVLQKKLDFLEELEKTKSPYEEGYKKVFGYYPVTDVRDAYWEYFQKGYEQAQKDYKVGEYQEPEENEWKLVALKLGENLNDNGPDGYYGFSADEWFEWVIDECLTNEVKRLQEKNRNVVRESVKWCEENPDKDPLDWLKPQTPEQVEQGLKEAFREAVKQGVVSSNKPKTLTDLIYDWWEDVFTTHSDWDMETSIANLVDEISLWLPTEHDTNSYKWNQCIRMIREKLR